MVINVLMSGESKVIYRLEYNWIRIRKIKYNKQKLAAKETTSDESTCVGNQNNGHRKLFPSKKEMIIIPVPLEP